jgi:hypothetical protein
MRQLLISASVTALVLGASLAHAKRSSDHADPTTKTLPAHASATAQANAFGQQGVRERAAHAAATSAAVDAAKDGDAAAAPDADGASAHGKSHAQGAAAQAQRGPAARAAHTATATSTHPTR